VNLTKKRCELKNFQKKRLASILICFRSRQSLYTRLENFYGNLQKKPGLKTLMYVSLPAADRLEKKTDAAGATRRRRRHSLLSLKRKIPKRKRKKSRKLLSCLHKHN
jgi:hypothetical protein